MLRSETTTVGEPCKCKVCGFPLDSVESIQKHYSYHLDKFTVTVDAETDVLHVRITSSSLKSTHSYTSPALRQTKPYPRLETRITVGSARKSVKKLQKSVMDVSSSENEEEPQQKRRREEKEAKLLGLDQFEGVRRGSLYGFQDHHIDAGLLEFGDVKSRDKQFASMWNHFRRRENIIVADSRTFQSVVKFIELNIDHLKNYRLNLLSHLVTLWQYRRVSRDQIEECMALYDKLVTK